MKFGSLKGLSLHSSLITLILSISSSLSLGKGIFCFIQFSFVDFGATEVSR